MALFLHNSFLYEIRIPPICKKIILVIICFKLNKQCLAKSYWRQGSSRSSVLGEAIINLAHYADALKPSVAALPLQGCDSGATLHVRVPGFHVLFYVSLFYCMLLLCAFYLQ